VAALASRPIVANASWSKRLLSVACASSSMKKKKHDPFVIISYLNSSLNILGTSKRDSRDPAEIDL
jgi:hypothetical protein